MKDKDKKIIHKRIDGELNKVETRIFKKKILKDVQAREEYERLKYVTDETRKIKRVPVSSKFSKDVVKKIKKSTDLSR